MWFTRCRISAVSALFLMIASADAQSPWKVGDRVDASFMGSPSMYRPGAVIEVGQGRYRVHFDGYTASYDDWVPAERVKPTTVAAPAPAKPGAPQAAATAGTPGCQIGMVVRAGALNYDAKILEFNPETGLYKVQFVTGYKGDIEYVPPTGLKTCKAPDISPVPEKWFVGVWQLATGGGGAWAKNPTTGSWKVIGLDVAGAPPIKFDAGGSYEWVIDSATTVRGKWRLAQQSELKYGYEKRGTTILVVNGESGKDWLVSRELVSTSDGRDRILIERRDLGLTYRGNRVGKR